MVVAVNLTGFISGSNQEVLVNFFVRLASQKPEHRFIFITDRQHNAYSNLPGNVQLLTSRPWRRHSFFWKAWYNRTLPALVKKSGAAVLIHASGVSSANCNIQQIIFANEYFLPKLFTGADKTLQTFFQKNSASIMKQASYVIVGSNLEKRTIAELYKTAEQTIRIIHPGIDEQYEVADYFNKEATKEKNTEGKEYFLFNGPVFGHESALVNLLKAFSFLKKRQKTNMQLVLIPGGDSGVDSFIGRLKTYKYRDEVKILTGLSEMETRNIIAAAYAFVYPLPGTPDSSFILRAIQCGLPLIVADSPITKDVAGEAALYVDATNFMDIANHLMLVFKDEAVREKLEQQSVRVADQLRTISPEETLWILIAPAS